MSLSILVNAFPLLCKFIVEAELLSQCVCLQCCEILPSCQVVGEPSSPPYQHWRLPAFYLTFGVIIRLLLVWQVFYWDFIVGLGPLLTPSDKAFFRVYDCLGLILCDLTCTYIFQFMLWKHLDNLALVFCRVNCIDFWCLTGKSNHLNL